MVGDNLTYKEMVEYYQHVTKYLESIALQNEEMFTAGKSKSNFSEYDKLCEQIVAKVEKAGQVNQDGESINIAYLDLSATCNNHGIKNTLQVLAARQAVISDSKQKWINMDRKFSDIAKDGPRNMAEAYLLDIAINNLTPHEFSQAVAKDLQPKAMEELIETSRLTRMVESILTADHQMRRACELETSKRSMHMEKTEALEKEVKIGKHIYRSKESLINK